MEIKQQLDTAWEELREIRKAINANPEESTADEVRRVVSQRDKLLAALNVFTEKYAAAPDGELGIGLVNGDFLHAKALIAEIEAAK